MRIKKGPGSCNKIDNDRSASVNIHWSIANLGKRRASSRKNSCYTSPNNFWWSMVYWLLVSHCPLAWVFTDRIYNHYFNGQVMSVAINVLQTSMSVNCLASNVVFGKNPSTVAHNGVSIASRGRYFSRKKFTNSMAGGSGRRIRTTMVIPACALCAGEVPDEELKVNKLWPNC